ncbi:hypothetical protein YA0599_03440 [Pseudomonas syringae]|uniref:hypothetical protein n=1 Tax=Pseudomonas syringae TaxID=317 RepID=UPI0018E5E16B|nr:hypothetical protein [Pseudomonas syringae]MBI6707268.1 hypothetical protein [Pseudomonas syringae]
MTSYVELDIEKLFEAELKNKDSKLWSIVEKSVQEHSVILNDAPEVFDPKNPNPKLLDEARILLLSGSRSIDRNLLKYTIDESLRAMDGVEWNTYNRQRTGVLEEGEQIVMLPSVYPVYKPYRSHNEAYEFEFGGLVGYEYEPKHLMLDYVIKSTYTSDTNEVLNNRIVWECKGRISSLIDAKKYVNSAKQNHVHFIFVFQSRNITCPWTFSKPPRKDGTRMTLEEWCVNNGFDFCYMGEVEAFKKTEHFKWLVENVGKGLNSLAEQLESKEPLRYDAKPNNYSLAKRMKRKG